MNKLIRSALLELPTQIYQFLYEVKNSYHFDYYRRKVHEPDFLALNLLCSNEPEVFLDIGANAGMSALSILTLKPNAKVISFEPNSINFPYLDKLEAKFDGFCYLPIGLGKEATSLNFYYPIYNHKHMTALGSCDRTRAISWLRENVSHFDEKKLEIAEITIEIRTLDSYDLHDLKPDFRDLKLNFIKIDVEGQEHSVLLGGEQTIAKYRPILLIEGVAEGDQIHQLLEDWQYQTLKFANYQFYLDDFDCDNNFFIPREKMAMVKEYLA